MRAKYGKYAQMRAYQPIVGSRQLMKIYIPKPLCILHIKCLMFTPLLSAPAPLHRCHSSLLRSLTLGSNFYFNLGTNLLHLNCLSNDFSNFFIPFLYTVTIRFSYLLIILEMLLNKLTELYIFFLLSPSLTSLIVLSCG